MKNRRKYLLALLFCSTLSLAGCGFQDVVGTPNTNPPKDPEVEPIPDPIPDPEPEVEMNVDVYDHAYDDLEVSSFNGRKASVTYMDYSKYSYYGTSSCPSIGTPKILIVPVWFSDSYNYITNKDNVRNDIESAYLGTSEETGWHSVSSFYNTESFGQLTLTGTVSPWYECGKASTYYYDDGDGYTSKTVNLVKSAVTWYKANHETDLSSFDTDEDGFIDGVILIYGAPDYVAMGNYSASNLWAYTYWTAASKSNNGPVANAFFWSSYDFLYSSGSTALSRTGLTSYGSGDTTNCIIDSHTFIHEMGHVLGLPDYYDYGGAGSPALGSTMQDLNIGGHDPYSRFALGWASAYHPKETQKIELKPFEESGQLIALSISSSTFGTPFYNYILIELYTPTGVNEFDSEYRYTGRRRCLTNYGIRIWHVDSRLYSVSKGKVTGLPSTGQVVEGTSNSTGDRANNLAGSSSYKQLTMLRRNYKFTDVNGKVYTDDRNTTYMTNEDLFVTGDYFTMNTYKQQFPRRGKLNTGNKLGWSVYFDSVTESGATITLIKD